MPKIPFKKVENGFLIPFPPTPFLWKLAKANEVYKLDTLLDGGLYMARLDRFNDLREGTLGRKSKTLLDKAPWSEKPYIVQTYENAIRQSFASCWHGSNHRPSDFVWNQFGEHHYGYAIRTSPERLRSEVKSVLACGAGYLGNVTYKNHDKEEIEIGNVLSAQFVVRDDYRDEEEVRFLIHTFSAAGQSLYGQEGPAGPLIKWRMRRTNPPRRECVGGYRRGTAILLGVNPRELIEEIVVGRLAPRSLFEEIKGKALKAGILCRRELDPRNTQVSTTQCA